MSRFHYLTGIGIEDENTGHIYNDKRDITTILNQIQNQAETNHEHLNNLTEYLTLKIIELQENDPKNELPTYQHIQHKLKEMMR